jgi:hypothetical protein
MYATNCQLSVVSRYWCAASGYGLLGAAGPYGSIIADVAVTAASHCCRCCCFNDADQDGFSWAGSTALHWAASAGNREQITLLLEAGARVTAVMNNSHTCLSLAAMGGKTSAVQQLLQAWDAPADVLQHAVQQAARYRQWDAAVLIIRHVGGQDRPAADALLAGMYAGNLTAALAVQQSLLKSWLDSETEQQRAALKQEAQEVLQQRAGLQQLLVGVAGTHSRIEAAWAASGAAAPVEDVQQLEGTHADVSMRAAAADGASVQVEGAQSAQTSLLAVSFGVVLLDLLAAVVVIRRLIRD